MKLYRSRGPHDLLSLEPICYSYQKFLHAKHHIPAVPRVPIISGVGFFSLLLLLQELKKNNLRLFCLFVFCFSSVKKIFLESEVITSSAALVSESCVISRLVCHSPDSCTVSEII